jgi:hypothetical protein
MLQKTSDFAGIFENSNELSGCIKRGLFLNYQRYYLLLENVSDLWRYFGYDNILN